MSLGQCNPQHKILWHLDRVAEWLQTGDPDPIIFEIDASNKCNQDCPWCSFSKLRSESKDMMCFNTMKQLISDMWKMDVKAINWTGGGEPLMNPDILDGISYAYKTGLDQGMFTNGLLLNEKNRNGILPYLTWLRISLDGYDDKTYSKSHGTSEKAFNTVIDNVKACATSPLKKCTLGLGYIITKDNFEGIVPITFLAKNIGVDYIQFKPVVYRPGSKQLDVDFIKRDVLPRVSEAEKFSDNVFNVMVTKYRFDDIMSPETNYGRTYKKCLSHFFQGAIGADSKVYLCDHHKGEKDYELGDLNKDSLVDIWDSNKRKEVIKFLDSTDLSQCQTCCRNHELNKFLWHCVNVERKMHPNHI